MTVNEANISELSVGKVLDLLSSVLGSDVSNGVLIGTEDGQTAERLSKELRENILANRDSLQQARIDIQQKRLESQQIKTEVAEFRKESAALFGSLEDRIHDLVALHHDRTKLLIDDIKLVCEEQVLDQMSRKKRKFNSTDEELLSLAEPQYPASKDQVESEDDELVVQETEKTQPPQGEPQSEALSTEVDPEDVEVIEIESGSQASTAENISGSTLVGLDTTRAPYYKMLRGTDSIKTIWEEYCEGVNGGPAVRELEQKFQGKWKDDTERKYFSYRKKLYRIIENVMRVDNKTADEAIDYLQDYITEPSGTKKSMTWLYDSIPDKYKG